jgi:hypothetical protein
MVTMLEIKAAYDSAKAALQIAQGINSLNSETEKNAAIIDVQRNVVDAQRGLSSALETIDQLEREIARLKEWAKEKERYELRAIGDRAVAYAEKASIENPTTPHWLCQPCFDKSEKSAMQFQNVVSPIGGLGMFGVWRCNRCHADVLTPRHATPANPDG